MKIRFLHIADLHLGNHQYQSDDRYNDFARAFQAVVAVALTEHVDFVAIAGDLFHKRAIDALTLYHAQTELAHLRDAGIPTLIIEGNHDRAFYRDAGISWLSFLTWTDAMILLAPDVSDGEVHFAPWDRQRHGGGFYDIAGSALRVYGLPWYGASTGVMIERTAAALAKLRMEEEAQGVKYRLIMLHTGVDGLVTGVHGLPSRQAFEPLRGLVDYIALGHVHMPYMLDDWIYNPGSLETVSAEEWEWQDRGYFMVEVETDGPTHSAKLMAAPRRRFVRERFRVDGYANPEELASHFDSFCARKLRDVSAGELPVVDITLSGTLAFDPGALDKRVLEDLVQRHCAPLLVFIRNHTQSLEFDPATGDLDGRDRASRQELELRVFRDLLLRDSRYATNADDWARVMAELKQHTLNGDDPAAIVDFLARQQSRLRSADSTS